MDLASCFKSICDNLQEQLNPEDISADLYSACIITESELEDVDNNNNTNPNRVAALLSALRRAINIDPGNYLTFLDILEKIPKYQATVKRAKGKLLFIIYRPVRTINKNHIARNII